jgi:hypothetical protein
MGSVPDSTAAENAATSATYADVVGGRAGAAPGVEPALGAENRPVWSGARAATVRRDICQHAVGQPAAADEDVLGAGCVDHAGNLDHRLACEVGDQIDRVYALVK